MKFGFFVRCSAVAAAVAATAFVATPAHAAVYATGEFSYTSSSSLCFEAYAGTSIGIGTCSVSLSVGTFAIVVPHGEDGTCSGVAPATLNITSPSTPSVPPAQGFLIVSHGVGKFSGSGSSGLVISVAEAKLTGSRCKPQNVLGSVQTLTGKYDLNA